MNISEVNRTRILSRQEFLLFLLIIQLSILTQALIGLGKGLPFIGAVVMWIGRSVIECGLIYGIYRGWGTARKVLITWWSVNLLVGATSGIFVYYRYNHMIVLRGWGICFLFALSIILLLLFSKGRPKGRQLLESG